MKNKQTLLEKLQNKRNKPEVEEREVIEKERHVKDAFHKLLEKALTVPTIVEEKPKASKHVQSNKSQYLKAQHTQSLLARRFAKKWTGQHA